MIGGMIFALACTEPAAEAIPTVQLGHVEATTPSLALSAPYGEAAPDRLRFGLDPHEPVGPWAIFADGEGFAVLDQVHRRILRFDEAGAPLGELPIPSAASFDAVAMPQGGYGLLAWHPGDDPHWSAQQLDAAGTLLADTRVELDPPTAVLHDGRRLLVEDGHAETVDPATGERFFGRPTGDGRHLRARREDLRHVRLDWSDGAAVRLAVDRPVVNLLALEPAGDEVLVGLFLMNTSRGDPDPEIRVLRVDDRGHLRRELHFEAGDGHDPNRPFALAADGSVLQLRPTATGVGLWRIR